jgi:hypothetical protein
LKKTDKEIKEIKLKKLFVVMNYDYEDPDWSSVEFIGLSKDECYDWIDENFEDYYEDE